MEISPALRILILGDHGLGKTTLCRALLSRFPELRYVSINDIRQKIGVEDIGGEYQAKEEFLRQVIRTRRPVLAECMGIGVTGYMLSDALTRKRKADIRVFYLKPEGYDPGPRDQHPDGALFYFRHWNPVQITCQTTEDRLKIITETLNFQVN